MGIFSRFRKNSDDGDQTPEHEATPVDEPGVSPSDTEDDSAPGWDAITAHFEATYPDQTNPAHYGTLIKYWMGGKDPIDGISVYRAAEPVPHWHYVTYGYSDVYGEKLNDADDAESGYGIEMTFRLADDAALDPEATPPVWVMNMLQNLARYVFTTGNVIYAGHHINANGPIALETDTQLTAVAFTEDPVGARIQTPSGIVRFVQGVGITAEELGHCVQWSVEGVLDTIGRRWPRGITILDRPGLDTDPELVAEVEEGIARDGSSMGSCFIETLVLEHVGDELAVTVSSYVGETLAQSAANRLPHGRPLRVVGTDAMMVFTPQEEVAIRDLSDDEPLATISLTEAGVNALADLPSEPGEYRLDEVPGIMWKLVATG